MDQFQVGPQIIFTLQSIAINLFGMKREVILHRPVFTDFGPYIDIIPRTYPQIQIAIER